MNKCRICGNLKLKKLYPLFKKYYIYNCSVCNTDSLFPIPSFKLIQEFHDDNYSAAYDDESFKKFKTKDFKRILGYINLKKVRTSLEIGCANAYLTEYLTNIGIDAYGVEIDSGLAKLAQKRFVKKRIFLGDYTKIKFKKHFDLIIMFDLLEHLADPIMALKVANKLLNKGGHILILTPNIESIKRKLLGKNWTGYYLEHFNCFSSTSIRYLAKITKLHIAKLENYHKLVNLRYFIRKLSWKFPILKTFNIISKFNFNPEFKINDDSMMVIFKK